MIVSISDLKIMADMLLTNLEQNGHTCVDIASDFYWSIPKDSRNNPSNSPAVFTVGQLTDDICELQRIMRGEAEPLAYGLVWLAAIIQAIGEEVIS